MKNRLTIIFATLLLFTVSCTKNDKIKLKASFVELSTDINITLFNVPEKDSLKASQVLKRSREIFAYFDSEMNPYDTLSALSRMNAAAAGVNSEIPLSLKEILKISANFYKYTDRYFNVAIHPVVKLWGFHTGGDPALPDSAELSAALSYSHLDMYSFTEDSFSVADGRCSINLGGIAKGYAADSVGSYLIHEGFRDFIVEAGGDLSVSSLKKRMIGVRHPREKDSLIDTLFISKGCLATSGDYEKYIEAGGVRYCHIINPYTGYGTSDIVSISVISDKTYKSDAFATAAFAMGREKAEYIIRKNGLSGIIYYLDEKGGLKRTDINMENYLNTGGHAAVGNRQE